MGKEAQEVLDQASRRKMAKEVTVALSRNGGSYCCIRRIMKRRIIRGLEAVCTFFDFFIIDRLPVRMAIYWNHPLVLLSLKLEDKWEDRSTE